MDGPLKDEHCECLNRCLAMAAETDDLLAKLERCGLDVQGFREEQASKKQLAENLKRTFFPHRA